MVAPMLPRQLRSPGKHCREERDGACFSRATGAAVFRNLVDRTRATPIGQHRATRSTSGAPGNTEILPYVLSPVQGHSLQPGQPLEWARGMRVSVLHLWTARPC